MKLSKKYAKHCGRYGLNMLLPCENEWTCFSSGFNLIKRKNELTKNQRKIETLSFD